MKVSKSKMTEDKIEAQRETFIAALSHDLKNPTIAQIRALELCLKGNFGQILPKQREVLEMVLDSCKYMNAMLCSVLATYRTDKGSVTLSNDEISIPDLAAECIDEIVYLAKDKEIKVSVFNFAEAEMVWGDRIQIKRVIMNLLTNGIKYAFKNSELKVKIYNEEGYTCFCFENRSPYISPEMQTKIFAQYVSFAKNHNAFGIGLGLYASKKIVEAHDGIIFVQSFPDERNIFGFKIPNSDSYALKQRTVYF